MTTRRLILGSLGAATLVSLLTPRLRSNRNSDDVVHQSSTKTNGSIPFANASLTNHLGQKVKFYDDLIKDKFVIINMFYAQCGEGVCPISMYNMRQVHKALGDYVGRDVHMYSITLLPDFDTPEVLNRYAKTNRVGNGWQLLTGKHADIEIIRRQLGFYDLDPKVDADKSQHAGMVRVGSTQLDRWLMAPTLGQHQAILEVINHVSPQPFKFKDLV